MRVKNMESAQGNVVANQFIITDGDVEYFQSYKTIIVKREGGHVYLDTNAWDYSKTTAKYRNKFLSETTKGIESRIKSGEYVLTNLN